MKRKLLTIRLVAFSCFSMLLSQGGYGHHSVAVGFDMNTEFVLTGTIKGMDFINPHARMFFEVVSESNAGTWTVWFSSANNLFRRGWRADDLPVGATVTVSGFPARDGSLEIYGGETTLPDGRVLFGGNRPGER